jgi:hypothetical protein
MYWLWETPNKSREMSLFEQFHSLVGFLVSDEDGESGCDKHLATPLRKQTIKLAASPLKALTVEMWDIDPEIGMHIEIITEADIWRCKATQLKPILDSFKALEKHIDKCKEKKRQSEAAERDRAHRANSRKP